MRGDKRRLSFFEKISAALLCKGDLSEETLDAQPCDTLALFRFATCGQKVRFLVGLMFAVLSGVLMPLNTVYSGMIAKIYLESGGEYHNQAALDAVMSVILLYAVSAALIFLFSFVQQYLLSSAANELVDKLRREYLSSVLRASAATLDATSPGKMSSVLNENIDTIRDGMGDKIGVVVRCFSMYITAIALSMWLNWKVTLCMMPLGPLCAMIMGLMGKFLAKPMKRQMDSAASAAAIVEESIMHVRTVASCNGQADMVKKYAVSLESEKTTHARVAGIKGFFEGAFFFSLYAVGFVAIVIGVVDAHSGGFSKGSVVIAYACVNIASFFMGIIGPHVMALLKARIAAAVIYKTIDQSPPLATTEARTRLELSGDIVFDSVRFKYAKRDVEVLKGLSFSAGSGRCIALAGHSGCGKSTTVALLTKLYSCTDGGITIDGVDINDIDTQALRQAIGIVSQEPCLFNGTIRENIVLGRICDGSESEDERLQKALKIAHAHEIVARLDKGVETMLGKGGIALSGGQQQRIAIARALFMNPSILILDEATSALDAQSETAVQEALNEARSGRTTIVIAHRLSTLKSADVICVLDNGVVAEQGTHESLMKKGEIYVTMVGRQSLASEDPKVDSEDAMPVTSSQKEHAVDPKQSAQSDKSSSAANKVKSKHSSLIRLYTHGFYGQMATTLLFSLGRGLEMSCYVFIVSRIYAALDAPDDEYGRPLTMFSLYSIVLGLLVWGTTTAANYFSGVCSESVLSMIKKTILAKVLHRDAEYFDGTRTSNATIVNDLNQQSEALAAGLDGRMVMIVWCMFSCCVCLARSIWLQWQIGLYGLAASVSFLILLLILFYLMTNLMEREAKDDRSAELALEIFAQTRIIQVTGVQKYFEGRFEIAQIAVHSVKNKVVIVKALTEALCMSSVFIFGLVAFATGAQFVYDGALSGLSLFIVDISIEFCGCCLFDLNPIFPDIMRANAAARILYPYFDLPDAVDGGSEENELKGAINVQNLSFAYPSRPEHEVTRSLNLSVSVGESIALVGPSGCGKSTIITLLERFYEQRAGEILLDGLDHRRISLAHLRKQIALVGQQPVLFDGTIMENILLGCDGSLEDVIEACKTANAAAFIEALPEDYDTILSAMGRSLSGGQKQRIAIARALVRKPKILLLDEATSALDGKSEGVVQEALANASSGRTTLSIAHRLSSIKDATRIFFIENGTVVESGSHEDLSRANGKYAAYAKAQSLE